MARVKRPRFLASVLAVGATLALYRLVLSVNNTTVALSLLLVVLGVSARWGLAEATVASVVAVLGLNYYFREPVGTLTIEDPQNWVALCAFLVTAVTASQLSTMKRLRNSSASTGGFRTALTPCTSTSSTGASTTSSSAARPASSETSKAA